MARKPARHIQKASASSSGSMPDAFSKGKRTSPSVSASDSQMRIPYESKEYKEIQKDLRRLRRLLL